MRIKSLLISLCLCSSLVWAMPANTDKAVHFTVTLTNTPYVNLYSQMNRSGASFYQTIDQLHQGMSSTLAYQRTLKASLDSGAPVVCHPTLAGPAGYMDVTKTEQGTLSCRYSPYSS